MRLCLCAVRSFRCPFWCLAKIFLISQGPREATSEVSPHPSPASNRWGIFVWNVYSRVLTTLGFRVAPREVVPVVIFHFGPLGTRCGPGMCVYAAQGDAWRQTSTPHPNNRPPLCLPPLCWLIIRIVSRAKWGRSARGKAPSPNSSALTLTSPAPHAVQCQGKVQRIRAAPAHCHEEHLMQTLIRSGFVSLKV